MDISTLSDTELKALAYDELLKLQAVQANLDIITAELNRRTKQPAPKPVPKK